MCPSGSGPVDASTHFAQLIVPVPFCRGQRDDILPAQIFKPRLRLGQPYHQLGVRHLQHAERDVSVDLQFVVVSCQVREYLDRLSPFVGVPIGKGLDHLEIGFRRDYAGKNVSERFPGTRVEGGGYYVFGYPNGVSH